MVKPFIAEFKAKHDFFSGERTFRVQNQTQEFFQIGERLGYHERRLEQVKYFSQDPELAIKEIEYEGWRRHIAERRNEEGGRIILHVRNIEIQAKLARSIEQSDFKKIGWLEPIRVTEEDPILCVNFCETAIEDNPNYIDNFFQSINFLESFPKELINDLKYVIAYNCVDRFKRALVEVGFNDALPLIRPTSLEGVLSPFYVAALYCRDNNMLSEARELLSKISKKHRQFEEARQLERALYEQEIKALKNQIQKLMRLHKKDKISVLNKLPSQNNFDHKPRLHSNVKEQSKTYLNLLLPETTNENLTDLANNFLNLDKSLRQPVLFSKKHLNEQNYPSTLSTPEHINPHLPNSPRP